MRLSAVSVRRTRTGACVCVCAAQCVCARAARRSGLVQVAVWGLPWLAVALVLTGLPRSSYVSLV